MAKKVERVNHRVEIEPEVWGRETNEKYTAACQDIVAAVKRHVDGVRSVGHFWDTETTCEYCGSVWEEDPWCCDEAREEIEAPND